MKNIVEDKVKISIQEFEELLYCKFKLEIIEKEMEDLKTEKYRAEVECVKYQELYEAKLRQEATEISEVEKKDGYENQSAGSRERKEDQSSQD